MMDYLTWRAMQEWWFYALNGGLALAIVTAGWLAIRIVCFIEGEIDDEI